MNRSNRSEATDEIIAHAFNRSVMIAALLAALVVAAIIVKVNLQQDETLLEAPVVAAVPPPDVPAVVSVEPQAATDRRAKVARLKRIRRL